MQLAARAVQVELEADAEAALLVCPRSPALASEIQSSKTQHEQRSDPHREEEHCSSCRPSCVAFQTGSWNAGVNMANSMKYELLCLERSTCLGTVLVQERQECLYIIDSGNQDPLLSKLF